MSNEWTLMFLCCLQRFQ